MKITKHGKFAHKLTRFGLINCYLVEDGDSLILVDTNLPNSAEAIMNAAADIGKPITKMVITHGHSDHIGSAEALAAQLPAIEFYVSARTAAYMRGDFALPAGDTAPVRKGNFPLVSVTPTQEVADGDQVGPLRVLSALGHTRDQIALFDTRDNTLFAGDSWQSTGSVAVMGDTRWLFPFPSLISWSKRACVESAERALALEPNRLCAGHGPVIENALPIMRTAYARAKKKIS